jgi:hypothetical protein
VSFSLFNDPVSTVYVIWRQYSWIMNWEVCGREWSWPFRGNAFRDLGEPRNPPYRITFIRGPFAKFVDSPYYSESELCGRAVTGSFSKYLPWQAMHFLQCSTHFSKTCCRLLITPKFLASELPFHGWKGPEIAWDEIWIEFCVRLGKCGSMESH